MNFDIRKIGESFDIFGDYSKAEAFGGGHINDTYRVTYNQAGTETHYIFQRINHNVFKNPVALMENYSRVTSHQRKKMAGLPDATRRCLEVHPTLDGKYVYQGDDGTFWRSYSFVEGARTFDIVESEEQAFQAARAFGNFQMMLVDLPGERLHETIPFFHDTPKRYETFEKVLKEDPQGRAKLAGPEIDFVLKRKDEAGKLLELNRQGEMPERITHNDTKLNNVLIDDVTGEGICVIDLDTVMPGLALYDFGDMVRTTTSPAAEDETDLSKVTMRMNMFDALARGYIDTAGDFLTPAEKQFMPFSGKLITLEIGVRFLTDFIEGDVYFKTHRDNHNLDRCRTQFKLVDSIEKQEDEMLKLIDSI